MLSSLEADRVRVADFDSDVQDLLASVSAQQAVAQKLDSNSYQCPVLTLPNEVIGEIFLHFVPAYPLCPPFFGTCSPIILTQICREWREIALSTPALWRAIPLTQAENRPAFPRGRIHRANTWLRRSGCCPLSIEIEDYSAAAPELLAAVTPHSARWEYLKLHDTRWCNPWQSTALEGPMPSLRHLYLHMYLPETDVLTLGEVPLLRSVTLDVLVLTNVVLPWAQLTSLTLPSVAPLECVPLLQQATNLVHCTLGLCFSQDGTGNDLPELTLPFLESLTLLRKSGVTPCNRLETRHLHCALSPSSRNIPDAPQNQ
ncbi:hypothetical protein GGX14DRAFT_618445 [Mycena pura]|uniref:F-box domain-containing protein n=1 Tax=Mycena pura TaxID=153505 RepID=A0AAD6Y0K8_9AGAR|nr:hypothetical protein GGX14DRAFT_618445 [Mycena pura]